jgi:probable rRNA maturation factor
MKRAAKKSSSFKFSLAVQYAGGTSPVPTRAQLRRWIKAALQCDANFALRIVDGPEGRKLNKKFRGKDYATNVLTFVYDDVKPLSGDVVICAPVVEKEAREQHKDLMAHYAHLAIHASLHLQGYDHGRAADAAAMESLETAIMQKLGYANPYQGVVS